MLYVFDLGNRMAHSFSYESHGGGFGISPTSVTVGAESGLIRTVSAGDIIGRSGGYSGALVVGYGYQFSRSVAQNHSSFTRSDGTAVGLSISLGLQVSNTGFIGSESIDDFRSADVRRAFNEALVRHCGSGGGDR